MKRPVLSDLQHDRVAAATAALSLSLFSAALLVMWVLTGYCLFRLAGLILLLPGVVSLILPLPVIPAPAQPLTPEGEQTKKTLRQYRRAKRTWQRKLWYHTFRNVLAVCLAVAAVLVCHLLFWRRDTAPVRLNFLYPVLVAVLFVLAVVLEKWCRHILDPEKPYTAALLQNLAGAFFTGRLVLLVTAAGAVLKILDLWDPDILCSIVLALIFVYETVLLLFSLSVRIIRKELDTKPELPVSLRGMGEDMNILRYLEENTGITMRALWSLQLIKRVLLPAALALMLLLWLSTGIVQIESHQQGALFRLGKLHTSLLEPGIHLTLPWPMDRVDVYDTKVVGKVTIGYIPEGEQDNIWTQAHGGEEYRLLLGGGNEMVSVNLQVEYRISDLYSYIRSSADPVSLLQAHAYEMVTARTITTDLDTLLAADREAFSKSFQSELHERMLQYHTGLEVVSVVLESIHPPVEVAGVYQNIINAEIDAQYHILNNLAEADSVVKSAYITKTLDINDALVRKNEQLAAARSAVTQFMAAAAADSAYRDSYRYQKYLKALTEAYSGAKLIIAGTGVDTANIYIGSLNPSQDAVSPEPDYSEDPLPEPEPDFYE